MSGNILGCSVYITSWFLPTPSNKSESSSGSESIFLEQSECLEDSDKSSSIIIGTSLWSSVPGVDVSSCNHNLFWLFRTFDFEYQVIRVAFRHKRIFQTELCNYLLTSILHSLEHFSILNSDSSCGNFGLVFIVLMIACVHWVDAGAGNWPYQHGCSSIFGNPGSSIYSIFVAVVVVDPRIVEANYFSIYFIFVRLHFVPVFEHDHFSFDCSMFINSYPEIEGPRPITPRGWGKGLGSYKVSD